MFIQQMVIRYIRYVLENLHFMTHKSMSQCQNDKQRLHLPKLFSQKIIEKSIFKGALDFYLLPKPHASNL